MEELIGIIVVNYNGELVIFDCINSVLNSTYQNFKLIIIDNKSIDKSTQIIESFDDQRIIKIYNDQNTGFTGGNNIGIKKSMEFGTKYTLLLNNDTVVTKEMLELLVDSMKTELVASPKIYFYNTNILWYGGGSLTNNSSMHLNHEKEDIDIVFQSHYDFAPFCGVMMNNKVFNEVGLLDENYYLYCEDTDYCFRLFKHGIRICYVKEAILYHKAKFRVEGLPDIKSMYYGTRNRLYFMRKFKNDFSVFARILQYLKARVKAKIGKITKNNYRIATKAIKDFKENRMGRCNDFK